MRLLLDTNALIWGAEDAERLRPETVELLRASALIVSMATLWEVAIKEAIGKLKLSIDLQEWAEQAGIHVLPIATAHVRRTRELPLLHRDPFDRMLIAQAQIEGLVLVTSDAIMARYGVPIVPA